MGKKKECLKFAHNELENTYWHKNVTICGIDEAGRGALCGPVVVSSVILPKFIAPNFLCDSKKMTLSQRQNAYKWVIANTYYSIVVVPHYLVDERNIWQTTLLGMKKAFTLLATYHKNIGVALVDAMPLTLDSNIYRDVVIHSMIKGEDKSSSIAAASIVSKVTRDRLMQKYDAIMPGYDFDYHKGYGTARHQELLTSGRTIIHRETFLKKFTKKEQKDVNKPLFF
jgi:ribonuclease HII